jgi:hypothetical protein
MTILKEVINNHMYVFEIKLNKEISKTIIGYYLENVSLKEVTDVIKATSILINRHNLLQKPIIKLYAPQCLMGAILHLKYLTPHVTLSANYTLLIFIEFLDMTAIIGELNLFRKNSRMRRNLI